MFILLVGSLQAQFIRRYGADNLVESGNVLLAERDAAGNETGNLFIAGTREDSTLIMLVGPNGNVLNEWTFKVCLANELEAPVDLRYDNANRDLIGCGRFPVAVANAGIFQPYAFRFAPGAGNVVWGNRFTTFGAGHSIIHVPDVTGTPPGLHMMGIFYDVNPVTNQLVDHAANYVRLDYNTGAIVPASDRVYTFDISPDDHNVAEYDAATTQFYSTGRWAYNANQTTFRANFFRSDNLGNWIVNRVLYGDNNVNMRTYGMDLLLGLNAAAPDITILNSGDYVGGGTIFTFAISRHDPITGNLTWGHHYDLPSFNGEIAHEIIVAPNGNYIVYGNHQEAPTRRVFMAEIDFTTGAVNWVNTYQDGLGSDDFGTNVSQSQMLTLNNSLYFIANSMLANDQGIMLGRTQLDGTTGGCHERTTLDETVIDRDFDMDPILGGTNIGAVNTPPDVDPNLPSEITCGCFAYQDGNYLDINADITISGNVVWPSKVVVGPGVTVTVNGGTLDITNSDVVFLPCARIVVSTDGNVRINNSVLRPCDELETWIGIQFEQTGRGVINTSTIKNALTGVDIRGAAAGSSFDVRITGNNFINCWSGIRLATAVLTEGITGNTFTVDSRRIDFAPVDCNPSPAYSNQHFGIVGSDGFFHGLVSQNDFVNTSETGSPLTFIGIAWTGCSGVISNNLFSNMYEAVGLSGCTSVTVENNEIELTMSLRVPSDAQIRATSGSRNIWITSNHLVNVVESYPSTALPAGAAIYTAKSQLINCKENYVEGFETGIYVADMNTANYSENVLRNQDLNGIVVINGQTVGIGCNEITLRARDNASVTTIGISYVNSGAGTTLSQPSFYSNCVFNAEIAMQTNRTSGLLSLPRITNNYFYNYVIAGVNNINFPGSIGSALAPFTSTGHNTFISNNVPTPGTFDVQSNVAISTFGNYGINNPGVLVSVSGNNLYNSNTACGHQVGTISEQYLPMDYCDNFTDNIQVSAVRIARGDFNAITEIPAGDAKRFYLGAGVMMKMMVSDPGLAAQLKGFLTSNGVLTYEEGLQTSLIYHMGMGEFAAAQNAVTALRQVGPTWSVFCDIHDVVLSAYLQGRSPVAFTAAEVAALQVIDDMHVTYSDLARQYLQTHDLNHNYLYDAMPAAIVQEAGVRQVQLHNEQLLLSPNPTNQHVRITFVMEHPEGAQITISDMLGRVMMREAATANHGYMDLDLSTWAKGIYNVSLTRPEGKNMNQKLVIE